MKLSTVAQEKKEFTQLQPEIIKQFVLDCFLHHKIKLIRNWGQTDDTDQLPFNQTTLLQLATKSVNFQILVKPAECRIIIMHTTSRGRKLYIYFVKKLIGYNQNYKPNF
jgi:hypothetical protein